MPARRIHKTQPIISSQSSKIPPSKSLFVRMLPLSAPGSPPWNQTQRACPKRRFLASLQEAAKNLCAEQQHRQQERNQNLPSGIEQTVQQQADCRNRNNRKHTDREKTGLSLR